MKTLIRILIGVVVVAAIAGGIYLYLNRGQLTPATTTAIPIPKNTGRRLSRFMPFSCEALLGLPSWSDWTISVSPQFRFINESGLAGVAPPDDTE